MLQPKNTITEPDYWQGDRRSFLDDGQIRTIALFIFLTKYLTHDYDRLPKCKISYVAKETVS